MKRISHKESSDLRAWLIKYKKREGLSFRLLEMEINRTVRRAAFPWYTMTASALHLIVHGKTGVMRAHTREALKVFRAEKDKVPASR